MVEEGEKGGEEEEEEGNKEKENKIEEIEIPMDEDDGWKDGEIG